MTILKAPETGEYRNSRFIYRVTLKDGSKIDLHSKRSVEEFVKENAVNRIDFYKSNGVWNDITKKYI